MSGRRAKAERRARREITDRTSRNYVIQAEYPSLTPQELAESAKDRLRRSRLAFENAGRKVRPLNPNDVYKKALGYQTGSAPHASVSKVDEWLNGWRMPTDPDVPDVKTSLTTYVGIVDSSDMPSSSSALKGKVPYSLITSRFIELCWKLTEIFPYFIRTVAQSDDVYVGERSRSILFAHLRVTRDAGNSFDEEGHDHELIQSLIDEYRDEILSERITSAAIRWAIAHEMAHVHGSASDRTDAYSRVERSHPNIMREQWKPKQEDLSDFAGSIESYKNEIACDLLANQFVLDSSFATDDIITQALGSLVALEALVWDGYDQDNAKISDTHPSPALRFEIVATDWKRIFADPATWEKCQAPGCFAISDFPYMLVFGLWAHGVYGRHREGAIWNSHFNAERKELLHVIQSRGADPIYAQGAEGLHRVGIINEM